jgi:sugar phosphate isomerase/epimerase
MEVRPFTFSSSTVLYGEQSLERACAELAAAGVEAVDLWHVRGWCEHLRDGAAAVRATLRAHGLRLEAVSAFGASEAELAALLPAAAELGAHAVVTGSAPPGVTVAAFAERMRPLVERAAALGVRLAIENHGQATIDSLASMVELAELLPIPALGYALAPIHLWNRGEETAEAVLRLRERIAFMYIWDWGPTAQARWKDPQEQFVGTGRIDFRPVFSALRAIGYDRPLCVFAHGPEHWPPERTTRELRAALARARALAAQA